MVGVFHVFQLPLFHTNFDSHRLFYIEVGCHNHNKFFFSHNLIICQGSHNYLHRISGTVSVQNSEVY